MKSFRPSGIDVKSRRRNIEFFEVQYVPDIAGVARYTVGLLAFVRSGINTLRAEARFISNPEDLRSIDPNVDVSLVRSLFREIQQEFRNPGMADAFLERLQDSFSNTIQLSTGKTVPFSGNVKTEVDRLAAQVLLKRWLVL